MTRWARANNVHKHKPEEATPWSELKCSGGASTSARAARPLYRQDLLKRHHSPERDRRPKKRKTEYENPDVNGFFEYLRNAGEALPVENADYRELKEEMAMALKKDQRRENRRIKRQIVKKNRMLCFNCRKPGHGLADCPEADGDVEMGRGICYRCGSTEHELQKCRAKVDPALGDYPYAKCFICGQTGHLSRSCPDNPKGLYAAGGCCRVCGSVEHFQKDCPEHQNSANIITVGRLSNAMSADHEDVYVPVKKFKAKQEKVVVF